MTAIVSLNSSFKFVVNENIPRRGFRKASEFVNHHDPVKQQICNSVGNCKFEPEYSIGKTSLSRNMKDLISYVEHGYVEDALQLFDEMNKRSRFVWNLVIRVLTNNGFFEEALDLYYKMCIEGVQADNFTFPFVIKACSGCLDLTRGRKVHSKLFKVGLDLDVHISNSLISMYAKLGYTEFAEKVFDEMPVRDLVSWNSMINGYVLAGDALSSLTCIHKMQQHKVGVDRFTIVSALNASSLIRSLPKGKEIHTQVIKNRLEHNLMIQTSLIDTYGKCGGMSYAKKVFNSISQRNIAAWNAMIRGYALNGQPLQSFSCLRKMQENNVDPDSVSLINVLPSCSGSILMGKTVHCYAMKMGFLPHIVLETALLDMYGKCGDPRLAKLAFNQIRQRNMISRNTLITALVQNGQYRESLRLFWEILNDNLKLDAMTITSILPAYSEIAQLKEGKEIHGYIVKSSFYSNTFVLNSLTFMYAKCGDLDSARAVFDGIFLKDVVSWNTIIMAYAIHGYGEVSVKLFFEMNEKGIKVFSPNSSTFVSLLYACSISGMVEEGWKYFYSMKKDYGIEPGIEHYGCMLDLLGRVGDLDNAKRLITEMPLEPTSRIWGSLLSSSRVHKNLEFAEFAANKIFSLKHDNTGLYVLLSNLYAENGRWEDVGRVKSLMKSQGLTKTIGLTMVEVKGQTFSFTNCDRFHQQSHLIYNVLDILLKNPCVDLSKFKTVDFLRQKSKSTDWHSVRLAVCFGLISTSIGKPVIVRKNVRICEDCHVVMKKISVICDREIVVGDSKIYHHFRHGQCSCRDYW